VGPRKLVLHGVPLANKIEPSMCRGILVHCYYISRESYRRREMYCGHARLCMPVCVSVCLSAAAYCMDPDVTWGSGRDAP